MRSKAALAWFLNGDARVRHKFQQTRIIRGKPLCFIQRFFRSFNNSILHVLRNGLFRKRRNCPGERVCQKPTSPCRPFIVASIGAQILPNPGEYLRAQSSLVGSSIRRAGSAVGHIRPIDNIGGTLHHGAGRGHCRRRLGRRDRRRSHGRIVGIHRNRRRVRMRHPCHLRGTRHRRQHPRRYAYQPRGLQLQLLTLKSIGNSHCIFLPDSASGYRALAHFAERAASALHPRFSLKSSDLRARRGRNRRQGIEPANNESNPPTAARLLAFSRL